MGWQDRAKLFRNLTASEGAWIFSPACCGVGMAWVLCFVGSICIRRKRMWADQ